GDRFFYLNESFTNGGQNLLNKANTLSEVIQANTDVTNLADDVFHFTGSISGKVGVTHNDTGNGGHGLSGVTVQLTDTSGNVLATTTTDSHGRYSFDQLSVAAADPTNPSGVSHTGTYKVALNLPPGLLQTSANPDPITITVSGTKVKKVNFTVQE